MIANIKDRIKSKISKRKINIFIIFLLLLFTIFLGIIVGISFSRYESKVVGSGSIEIAKPIIEIERQQSMITQITAKEPNATCTFIINNYNDNYINEVDMEYYIEIVSEEDECIEFELYKDGKQIELTNNKTSSMKLLKNVEQSDKYELNIQYNRDKNTSNNDVNENIEIKIHSIQKT